jgi:hypothetical protein
MVIHLDLDSKYMPLELFLNISSSILLAIVSPYFFLNLSNFLNSTTVHKSFSQKSYLLNEETIENIGDTDSVLVKEDINEYNRLESDISFTTS